MRGRWFGRGLSRLGARCWVGRSLSDGCKRRHLRAWGDRWGSWYLWALIEWEWVYGWSRVSLRAMVVLWECGNGIEARKGGYCIRRLKSP
jgi:hypothetical protein